MDAWGIIMTAVTMFGMLVLTVAHVSMASGSHSFEVKHDAPSADRMTELKKAA